jgi:hypothetical protein
MGTVFLSVSISQRQASNAAPRCAEETTISTLVSPISSRPSRCTSVTPRTPKRSTACAAKLGNLALGHLLVRLIVQIQRAPPARIVAHNAVEDHDRAVASLLGCSYQLPPRNRIARQVRQHRPRRLAVPARDRRQQANLIAFAKNAPRLPHTPRSR